MNSFPSSQRIALIDYFPLEANGERFLCLLVAFKNTATRRQSETKQLRSTTKQNLGSIVKTKYQSLTSLAFMQLVPGGNPVARHICIRCIYSAQLTVYSISFNKDIWFLVARYSILTCAMKSIYTGNLIKTEAPPFQEVVQLATIRSFPVYFSTSLVIYITGKP